MENGEAEVGCIEVVIGLAILMAITLPLIVCFLIVLQWAGI